MEGPGDSMLGGYCVAASADAEADAVCICLSDFDYIITDFGVL